MSSEDAEPSREEVDLETENLIATYDSVAEWIRFADAKAAVVLTVVGALAGLLIPTLKDYLKDPSEIDALKWTVLASFTLWLVLTVFAAISAFRCIRPFRKNGEHPALELCAHFHPAAISKKYELNQHAQFVQGYLDAGVSGFQREVLAGLLIDSHISAAKYGRVSRAIQLLGWSGLFALLYLLCMQF